MDKSRCVSSCSCFCFSLLVLARLNLLTTIWMPECIRVSDGSNDLRAPTYDPLEISEYLESGLLDSSLDKWFVGPIPKVSPSDTRKAMHKGLEDVLIEAKLAIGELETGKMPHLVDSAPNVSFYSTDPTTND